MQPLNAEARKRLEQRADDWLPTIGLAFRAYAKEIDAHEWASYDAGEVDRFIEPFVPMARDLAAVYILEKTGVSEQFVQRVVWVLIKSVCKAPSPPPPTWPWATTELFDNWEFQRHMRTMVEREVANMHRYRPKDREEPKRSEAATAGVVRREPSSPTKVSPHALVKSRSRRAQMDSSKKEAQRGRIRSKWVDEQMVDKKWTSDLEICDAGGPTYNTIDRYRSGRASNRDAYVRGKLADAFGCKIVDVPD